MHVLPTGMQSSRVCEVRLPYVSTNVTVFHPSGTFPSLNEALYDYMTEAAGSSAMAERWPGVSGRGPTAYLVFLVCQNLFLFCKVVRNYQTFGRFRDF